LPNSVAFGLHCIKSGWLAIERFSPEKCHKVHQLSTMDLLCSLRQQSFLSFLLYEFSNIHHYVQKWVDSAEDKDNTWSFL